MRFLFGQPVELKNRPNQLKLKNRPKTLQELKNQQFLIWNLNEKDMSVTFQFLDTKMIMGGGRIELSPDEWVLAVVELYYDICLIFQYMLALMGRD